MYTFPLQVCLLIFASSVTLTVYCATAGKKTKRTTTTAVPTTITTTITSTTEDDFDDDTTIVPTDIPQWYIDQAVNVDYGKYTTVDFHYENKQWMHLSPIDLCYDNYMKCITSLTMPATVCMLYSQYKDTDTRYAKTYCDAYFENCRLGYRYWRIIDYGRCDLGRYWDRMSYDVRRSYRGRKLH